MKYPRTTTSIALYNQSNSELWRLAEQFVKVSEPKKTRIAFKVAAAVLVVSIVGIPIAYAVASWRQFKIADEEDLIFNRLKSLRDMQIRNDIQEEINIHWQGNAAPHLGFDGDTALVWREMHRRMGFDASAGFTWRVTLNRPGFPRFDLEELRARRNGTPEAAPLLPEPAKPQPPSYESMFEQAPPPDYYELTRN